MNKLVKLLSQWLPPVMWAVLILGFSSEAFAASQTSRIIVPILKWLLPSASEETIGLLHAVIRKMAHLVEYAIFAALLLRSFRYGSNREWNWRWAAGTLLIALACAAADEYRQSLTLSRTGSAFDVLVDGAGAVTAIALISLPSVSRRKVQ